MGTGNLWCCTNRQDILSQSHDVDFRQKPPLTTGKLFKPTTQIDSSSNKKVNPTCDYSPKSESISENSPSPKKDESETESYKAPQEFQVNEGVLDSSTFINLSNTLFRYKIQLDNKNQTMEDLNAQIDKVKKQNEGLKECQMRMKLFVDTRNRQISDLNAEIQKHKETQVQLNQKVQVLSNVVAMIPHIVQSNGQRAETDQQRRQREADDQRRSNGTKVEDLKRNGTDVPISADSHFACSVCFSNKKQIVYGCGHFETCFRCNLKIVEDDSKCPMCRTPISVAIPIHGL